MKEIEIYDKTQAKQALVNWLTQHGFRAPDYVFDAEMIVREFRTRRGGEVARAEIKGGPYSWQSRVWEWDAATGQWRSGPINGDAMDWRPWEPWFAGYNG